MSTLAPLPDARPAPSVGALVTDYATDVRRALDDLPDETVEDLTDGLEADLLDALADLQGPMPDAALHPAPVTPAPRQPGFGGAVPGDVTGVDDLASAEEPAAGTAARFTADGLAALFGPPTEYADELRSSAGLAPRGVRAGGAAVGGAPEVRRTPLRAAVASAVRDTRASWTRGARELRHSSRWAPLFDFVAALRPVGWLARAWVLVTALFWTQRTVTLIPSSGAEWLVMIVAVVVSVQWGRGRWRPRGRGAWLVPLLSALAVVLALPTALTAYAWTGSSDFSDGYDQAQAPAAPDGVWVDGAPAGNLFVYDATGKLVPDAQVYDDRGQPVTVQDATGDEGTDSPIVQVGDQGAQWQLSPTVDANGSLRWNVFPLRGVPLTDDGTNEPVPGATPKTPAPPFERAPSIVAPGSQATSGSSSK